MAASRGTVNSMARLGGLAGWLVRANAHLSMLGSFWIELPCVKAFVSLWKFVLFSCLAVSVVRMHFIVLAP